MGMHWRFPNLQPLKYTFAFYDVFVIPLYGDGLTESALEVFGVYLIGLCVPYLCGFECSVDLQIGFLKWLPTPEHERDSFFLFAISNNGIALQKPDRMCMSYFTLCLRKTFCDLTHKGIADNSILCW